MTERNLTLEQQVQQVLQNPTQAQVSEDVEPAPRVDLATSLQPQTEGGEEGEFSSFINDPRTIQAIVFGLTALNSDSPNPAGAFLEGMGALGGMVKIREDRKKAEFAQRVEEEKVNLRGRQVTTAEQQLARQTQADATAEAGAQDDRTLAALDRLMRDRREGEKITALGRRSTAAEKANEFKAQSIMINAMNRAGTAWDNSLSENKGTREDAQLRALRTITDHFPDLAKKVQFTVDSIKTKQVADTKAAGPGVFSRLGDYLGDFLAPTEGPTEIEKAVAHQTDLLPPATSEETAASVRALQQTGAPPEVVAGTLPPSAGAAELPPQAGAVERPVISTGREYRALPEGTEYIFVDIDGVETPGTKGGQKVRLK